MCGDVHGEFAELVWTITNRYKITNADILVVGDFGMGFDNALPQVYKKYENRLEKADIVIHAIRGNHDDPAFFKDLDKFSYPRLKFLEDNKIYNLCGYDIYTIGGANSTDISWRLEYNQKLATKGKDRRVWWEDEDIVKVPIEKLPKTVDIIVSHEAPLIFQPMCTRLNDTPVEQYEKIVESRKYLDSVLENVNVDKWIYGHYHNSYSGSYNKTIYRGLGIMELFEVPDKIDKKVQGEDNNE